MIRVLILDDDPMVAKWNETYVNKVDGCTSVGVSHTYEDALKRLENERIDLLLLDIYIGAENGLELLQKLRADSVWEGDVILITAASDVESVKKAMRYGALDYIMKPFGFDRFRESMQKYKSRHKLFTEAGDMDQERFDEEWFPKGTTPEALPKGLSSVTMKQVQAGIASLDTSAFSTEEVAEITGISRVTVRKYLKHLADTGELGERLTYGAVGRPQHVFFTDRNV